MQVNALPCIYFSGRQQYRCLYIGAREYNTRIVTMRLEYEIAVWNEIMYAPFANKLHPTVEEVNFSY